MLILFNKPYGVISQFSDSSTGPGARTLSEFGMPSGVYPAGRLDKDSEGLLALTDDGKQQARLSDPKYKHPKLYWVQVENIPDQAAINTLRNGVRIKGVMTRSADAQLIAPPAMLWPRDPPIRVRQSVPDCWLRLLICEGRNRQVRRMTAAVGHPTLRLIRAQIGNWSLDGLPPGQWRVVQP